jgi:endonuclease/exonuclease/phosphatase family metal-dependent hydrolase
MSIKIASWNIEGRLSEVDPGSRGNLNQIITAIKHINADITVLLEAHSELSLDELKSNQQLIDLGYTTYSVPYEDDIPFRPDSYAARMSLMLLSKYPIDKFDIVNLGNTRNALVVIVHQPGSNQQFRVIGIHLDDRAESTRLKQIEDLSKIVSQSSLPTVVVGDYNAMHGDDLWPAKFLRSKPARFLAKFIMPELSLKAIGMATGDTLRLLQTNTGLRDADPRHQPTTTPKLRGYEWLPSVRLIQIDHMFISQNIKISDFQINSDAGADHRAIIATLDII